MTADAPEAGSKGALPDSEAIAGDKAPGLQGPYPGARVPVRRAFLQLLALALVPVVLVGIGRSYLEIDRNRVAVEARLSERALETARAQGEVVRTAEVVLRLLSGNTQVRDGGLPCNTRLATADQGFAAISNLSRLGADGRLVCSSSPVTPGLDKAIPEWWPMATGKTGFFMTEPHWGALSKRQVLVAVQPIVDPDGGLEGAVTASIDLGWMQRSLQSRGLGEEAVALVLDDKGRTVMSSSGIRFPPLDVKIGPGRVADRADASGRRWTYAVAPLFRSNDGGPTLYVAYAMPEARLFSAGWWRAGIIIAQPIIAVLLASLVIWYGTNRLVLRWLRELRQLAVAFTDGDFRPGAADFDKAPAEFRDVAAAFYRMGQAVERRDGKLRAALDQQSQLVKEIHHRVKNNLQIVMSLISLQAARIETTEGRTALNQTRLRISALALVHRLLYETGEQSTMSAAELLQGVCDLVLQTFRDRRNITLRAHFGEDDLALDTAIPLALWLVDAMSNAWLHAFPDGRSGLVDVSLVRDGGDGVLEVVDDGIGFAMESGTALTGRGLKILNGIGRQVGGRTDITGGVSGGTVVRLRYPTGSAARSANA